MNKTRNDNDSDDVNDNQLLKLTVTLTIAITKESNTQNSDNFKTTTDYSDKTDIVQDFYQDFG